MVCVFSKEVGSFKGNYVDLFFECQAVRIGRFISLFYFSYSIFKLKQNDSIEFSVSFFLKLSFDE